jgi:uncharacterized protein YidB (DUF937 family)
MSSWISTGPNQGASPGQIEDVFGMDTLTQFSQQAGVPAGQAGSILASVLPALISGLTPQGEVPQATSLEGSIGSLLGSVLGH